MKLVWEKTDHGYKSVGIYGDYQAIRHRRGFIYLQGCLKVPGDDRPFREIMMASQEEENQREELIQGMIETFRSQFYYVAPHMEFVATKWKAYSASGGGYVEGIVGGKGEPFKVLIVHGANVKTGRGAWFYTGNPNDFDLVQVNLGYSAEMGAKTQCDGNQNKDHFRRMGYGRDCKSIASCSYAELNWLFSEENVTRFLTGLPLISRGRG